MNSEKSMTELNVVRKTTAERQNTMEQKTKEPKALEQNAKGYCVRCGRSYHGCACLHGEYYKPIQLINHSRHKYSLGPSGSFENAVRTLENF